MLTSIAAVAVQAVRPTENFEPLAGLNVSEYPEAGAVYRARASAQPTRAGPEADLLADFERVRREAATQDYRAL